MKVFAAGLTPAIRFSCWCVPLTKEARMNVRYRVDLSQIERTELRALLSSGKHASHKLKSAQIFLAARSGDDEIANLEIYPDLLPPFDHEVAVGENLRHYRRYLGLERFLAVH